MSSGKTFSKQVSKFVKVAQGNADKEVRRIALAVLAHVVEASPVDTGRFRGNWQVGLGSRPNGQVSTLDPGGASTVAAGSKEIDGAKAGSVIFITNNLPYAMRLEYGWSQQAPRGMVRRTFASLKSIIGSKKR